MNGGNKYFSYAIYLLPHPNSLPQYQHPSPDDTFVTSDEPTLTHHHHQESIVHIRVHAKPLQSCPSPSDPWNVASRLLCPWDSPGKNTGVGCHALLQGIFLIQGLNPRLLELLHCRQILYCRATGGAHSDFNMIIFRSSMRQSKTEVKKFFRCTSCLFIQLGLKNDLSVVKY